MLSGQRIWSSSQSAWLQIQRSGFDSRRYQIFWEVVCLERGPLSLGSTIERLLRRNKSGSGLENRECSNGDPSRWPRDTLYPQKLALGWKFGSCLRVAMTVWQLSWKKQTLASFPLDKFWLIMSLRCRPSKSMNSYSEVSLCHMCQMAVISTPCCCV
jgi:hypothetical protein